jgi:ribonucleoside-diphosphate reductase alpha chain
MSTGCGKFYVTINEDEDGRIFEIFTSMGKAGGCASSQCEALGRMISVALRANISRTDIVRQLKGISCHQPSWGPGGKITSCADAVAKALEQHIKVHHEKEQKDEQAEAHGGNGKSQKAAPAGGSDGASVERAEEFLIVGACEECGGAVEHEGGCAVCHDCGHTKCG